MDVQVSLNHEQKSDHQAWFTWNKFRLPKTKLSSIRKATFSSLHFLFSCNATEIVNPVNTTSRLIDTTDFTADENPTIAKFYAISYMYLGTLALLCCVISGIVVSLITGRQKNLNRYTVKNLWKYFPEKIQRFMTCGTFPEEKFCEQKGTDNNAYATSL